MRSGGRVEERGSEEGEKKELYEVNFIKIELAHKLYKLISNVSDPTSTMMDVALLTQKVTSMVKTVLVGTKKIKY